MIGEHMITAGSNDSFTLPAHPMNYDWSEVKYTALIGLAVAIVVAIIALWCSHSWKNAGAIFAILVGSLVVPTLLLTGFYSASWMNHLNDGLKGTDTYASGGGAFSGWHELRRSELDATLASHYGLKLTPDATWLSPSFTSLDGKQHFNSCSLDWKLDKGEKTFTVKKPVCVGEVKLPKE